MIDLASRLKASRGENSHAREVAPIALTRFTRLSSDRWKSFPAKFLAGAFCDYGI